MNSRCFYSHFPEFSSILLKFVIIFKNSVVDFTFEDEQTSIVDCFELIFLVKKSG